MLWIDAKSPMHSPSPIVWASEDRRIGYCMSAAEEAARMPRRIKKAIPRKIVLRLLRRTCAKLCHVHGGELEQIQFLPGHASVLTTERYLGCKRNLEEPVQAARRLLHSQRLHGIC